MKKILVVGGGPIGLTAGIELSRHKIIPDLIDKKKEPSTLSRAVGILPHSMKLLKPSGAADKLIKQSVIVENAKFFSNSTQFLNLKINVLEDPLMRLFCLAQDRTEKILSEIFLEHGGNVEYNKELKELDQIDNKIKVKINDEEKFYDYVIGADGVKSAVRNLSNIKYEGFELEEDWSITDVYLKNFQSTNDFKVFLRDDGKAVIMIPLEPQRFRIISNTEDALKQVPVNLEVDHIKRSGKFKISIRQAESYQKGNIFLAGDAAHSLSPIGGRGMNLGIADAADLANRIIKDDTKDYHKVRRAMAKKTTKETETLRKIVLAKKSITKKLFFFIIFCVSKIRFLNKILVKRLLLVDL